MHARKFLLTVLVGGPVLGCAIGASIDPTLKPPPEPVWRHPAQAAIVPADAYYEVEAPPEDLSPYRLPPGYGAIAARRAARMAALRPVALRPSDTLAEAGGAQRAALGDAQGAADQPMDPIAASPDPASLEAAAELGPAREPAPSEDRIAL